MSLSDKIFLMAGVASCLAATPAFAQESGDSFARISIARTKLVDKGDVFVDGVQDPAAGYETREAFHGIVTGGYYVLDGVAVEASVSTPLTTNNLPAGSLAGLPNLGDDEFITLTLGGSYHPFKGRFSPYVGGGIQYQKTTQERDGLAVGLNIPDAHGPYVNAGFDYKIGDSWGVFADVRKAWYHTGASGRLPLDATFTRFSNVVAKAELDPLTVQLGVTAYFGKKSRESGASETAALVDNSKKWNIKAGVASLSLRDRAEMVVGGTPLVGEGISTYEHRTPSVQVSYFLADSFALNATLGLPPKIDIYAAGTIGALPKLGEVTYGPTAFTLQYHPKTNSRFRPYVGAGFSYMIVFDENDGSFQDLNISNDLAFAFEAGTEVGLGKDWGMFFDAKKAFLRPKVTGSFQVAPGTFAPVDATTKLDPWVFSAGLSFRL
jgi:outer membrane protein W